jgi:hypothetical protein
LDLLTTFRVGHGPVAEAIKLCAQILVKGAVAQYRSFGNNRELGLGARLVDVARFEGTCVETFLANGMALFPASKVVGASHASIVFYANSRISKECAGFRG